MPNLKYRPWVPEQCERYIQDVAGKTAQSQSADIASRIESLTQENRHIHERDCFNLNPATNVMNPRAEALLSSGIGTRPSLGYPGDKYEMGLEAIQEIEVMCAELCAEVFQATYAEIRVPSGRLQIFMHLWRFASPGMTYCSACLNRGACDTPSVRMCGTIWIKYSSRACFGRWLHR